MPALVDRQWTDAWIPPGYSTQTATVCMTYHDFGPSQMWVSCSFDAGRHFDLPVDAITSIPIWSAYSDDGGQTWTDQLVYDAGPLHDGSEIFADLTLDNQGNLYVGLVMNIASEYDIWVAASLDGGITWNGKNDGAGMPYRVNADQGTHFFAAIAAGDPGEVDVACLDTPTLIGSTPYGKPNEPSGDANADWNVFVGQSTNLLGGSPTFKNTKLTPAPMHHGHICTLGLCAAVPGTNRNLLDFIDVQVDPSGFFHVAYTDGRNYQGGAPLMANQTSGMKGPGGH